MVIKYRNTQNVPSGHRLCRHRGWIPVRARAGSAWLARQVAHVDAHPRDADALLPAMIELRDLIEGTPRVYMYFSQMWDEVAQMSAKANSGISSRGSMGKEIRTARYPSGRMVRDYKHMLALLDHVLRQAPEWSDAEFRAGMVGAPVCSVFEWAMVTPSGHAAFIDPQVNAVLKRMLNDWGKYLQSPESTHVLGTGRDGWLGERAVQNIVEEANAFLKTSYSFEEAYECEPRERFHGFKSWDDFFTRQIRLNIRPVASPSNDNVVANCCEARAYNIAYNARLRDRFWIKGQPYSVLDMLGHDALAHQFGGATVYQGYLSVLAYHRWHAPVTGTVKRAFVIDGTYFSEMPPSEIGAQDITYSQAYLSSMAARAVIFIEADNPAIGLVAFIAIGMDEVSTCEITVCEGQRVVKGEQTGMFHFGGSSHCLLFRGDVDVRGFPDVARAENVPVRGQLAVVNPV